MTCVVGLAVKNSVYIAADSAAVWETELVVRRDPKVFQCGPLLIGFTSSFRMGQLLQYGFDPPEHGSCTSDSEYLVTRFAEAVRNRFKEGGFSRSSDGQDTGGSFLIGYRGKLYSMEADYHISEAADDFAAVGAGAPVALGSLFSTTGKGPEKRLLLALEASERFCPYVRGPFVLDRLRGGGEDVQ